MLNCCRKWIKTSRISHHIILLVSLTVFQSLAYSAASRQPQPQQHGGGNSARNRNLIETEQQCKHYLCKYGYLNCNCTTFLLPDTAREKRAINLQQLPTELDDTDRQLGTGPVTMPPILTTPSFQTCEPFHLRRGYEKFQNVNGLHATGFCDDVTKSYMSRRRCGQPDVFDVEEMRAVGYTNDPNTDSSTQQVPSTPRRSKRSSSISELLAAQFGDSKLKSYRAQQLDEIIAKQPEEHLTYNNGQSTRQRRSTHSSTSLFNIVMGNDYNGIMRKSRVTWRLMSAHTTPQIPVNVQNSLLAQAFRYWGEASPLCFVEDKHSRFVDIEVGFLEGTHLDCHKRFDGNGGEVAHKFYRDVHFDKEEPFSDSPAASASTISLTLVAVHEIGHVLGLNHSLEQQSVMNAIYHRHITGDFELDDHDRSQIKKLYGPCSGSFDVVMDYVRNRGLTRVFNTYFFRGNSFWKYENTYQRPDHGDPRVINTRDFTGRKVWDGVPGNLDTFVHFFETDLNYPSGIAEHYFFFKGSNYYRFDPQTDKVVQTGLIQSMFRPSTLRPGMGIPNNLDASFFEHLTKTIFFFKNNLVYKYQYSVSGTHECSSEEPKTIKAMFPPAHPSDEYSPNHVTYTSNLDAVYLSWRNPFHLYFIKGDDTWRVEGYSIFGPYNETLFQVKYLGKWNTMWHYICEAECS